MSKICIVLFVLCITNYAFEPCCVFKITFEGITGATVQGDMALDDILVSNRPCIPPGFCDFEINLCGWTNIEVVDEGDWLRSKGATPNMNTGPSVDHMTDSGQGERFF